MYSHPLSSIAKDIKPQRGWFLAVIILCGSEAELVATVGVSDLQNNRAVAALNHGKKGRGGMFDRHLDREPLAVVDG